MSKDLIGMKIGCRNIRPPQSSSLIDISLLKETYQSASVGATWRRMTWMRMRWNLPQFDSPNNWWSKWLSRPRGIDFCVYAVSDHLDSAKRMTRNVTGCDWKYLTASSLIWKQLPPKLGEAFSRAKSSKWEGRQNYELKGKSNALFKSLNRTGYRQFVLLNCVSFVDQTSNGFSYFRGRKKCPLLKMSPTSYHLSVWCNWPRNWHLYQIESTARSKYNVVEWSNALSIEITPGNLN